MFPSSRYEILLSVLPIFDALNLLKQDGTSVAFALFILGRFTSDLPGIVKLTATLEWEVAERMLTISVSKKLDMSIKESTVNQKGFFLNVHLKIEYNTQEHYFSESVFSNSRET